MENGVFDCGGKLNKRDAIAVWKKGIEELFAKAISPKRRDTDVWCGAIFYDEV